MINTRQDYDYWDPARKGFVTNYPNFPHWKRLTAEQIADSRLLNIYLHTPYCIQRCSYCVITRPPICTAWIERNAWHVTLTNFADHSENFSHDTINRYLRGERITPRLIWDNVQGHLVPVAEGYLIFDDTVLDKGYSRCIEWVRRPWSGKAKAVIKGVGVVTCLYFETQYSAWAFPHISPRTVANIAAAVLLATFNLAIALLM
jgi:hypothetical protein